MTQYGERTSFYIQAELISKIDRVLAENPEFLRSRSAFINSAIVRELRRIESYGESKDFEDGDKAVNS